MKSDKSCEDDTVRQIKVGPEYSFVVPNSFTPNGHGVNDIWLPQGQWVEGDQYELSVFDRWGKRVWTTDFIGKGWDGRNMKTGELLMQGTYTYQVITGDLKSKKDRHEYVGTLSLLR